MPGTFGWKSRSMLVPIFICAASGMNAWAGPANGVAPPPPAAAVNPAAPAYPAYPYPVVNPVVPPPGSYPAIPMALPQPPGEAVAPPVLTPYVPSVEPSPIGRITSPPNTRSPGGPRAAKVTAIDPRWNGALQNHAKGVRECQRELDKILARHGYDWVSLSNDPKDRLRCEEILQRWTRSENQLSEAYQSGRPPVASLSTPSDTREELNAADIGR